MRIKYLLLFGILLSITAAVYTATTTTTTKKPIPKSTITKTAKTRTESALKTTTTNANKDSNTKNARNAKSLKTAPGESRGKRTLYDFGNPGYIYSDIASRRAGYVSDNDAQQNSYNNYPQNGYFNGQNAIAQFPGQFGGYSGYPQYLEAPEPIIEIIIKDSNETLATEPPQPIVTKKKKKEKVHVFYVNYKKDENNKLHLESPIASLNNDDTEEEEEEQIVQIPSAVTPPPTYRTTTLRTIIHPDSEKFHSNSGIHVTFGSADKKQRGHELEESDAESIQSQVIALPLTGSPNVGSHGKSEHLYANTRADFGVARAPSGNYINQSPYYHVPQQQQSNYYQSQQAHQQQQQLPQAHSTTLFRQQPSVSAPAHTKLHSKPKPQQQQQQQQYQQQQRPHFLPTIPPATSSHQQQSSSSSGVFGKLLQQSNYYVNHNQQYPSYTTPRNQYYQTQTSTSRPTSAPKQSIFFPTSPPKQQELPSRQTPAPYQPVKFRPTSSTPQQSKPLKLQNTGYQTLQQQHQQYYQHKQQQQQQTQQYQPQQQQQQQSQYQAQPQQQQHQYQPQQQQELPTKSQPFQFNRQPQYVQQPTFTVPSPNLPSSSSSQNNYYQKQQSQSQFHNSQQSSQKPSSNTKYQSQQNAAQPQAAAGLSTLHNYFDIKPSKETELLKSIPKFEQHITETIHHSGSQQHVQRTVYNPQTSFQTQNQVIHDVPAPNLGPTHKPQQSSANQASSGHYITASSLNSQQQPQAQPLQQQQPQQQHSATQSQYSNFVAAQNYASSTQSPQFESNNGQKIMIVTPMPPINYQQYHSSQYTGANQGGSNYVQQQQQHHQQQQGHHNTNNFGIDPRQPASASIGSINNVHQDGSEYSVSTHHADVFKELERRKQQHQQQQQQYQQYEYSQNTQPQSTQKLYTTASSERPLPASSTSTTTPTTKTPSNGQQAPPSLLQLPDEVPDDLRQQLLSSGILNNADISVLDYDKVGDIALENLPAEHLQHFYGAGGGAQISESNKVVTAVKPNGDSVALSEKDIERVKQTNALPQKHNLDLKVVRFNSQNEKNIADKYVKSDATVVSPVDLASNQYNRYLPLKINGAQFPIPNSDELNGKKVVSVVVLAPVESTANSEAATITGPTRSQRDEAAVDAKEVKFLGGDLIKTLVKKPTKENFKRWLDKEAHTEVEQQSVVLLVAKSAGSGEQEIFMYDISTGSVNKLNGELSSAFVNVAEENASSEDLEHASTLDPSFLDTMMMTSTQRR